MNDDISGWNDWTTAFDSWHDVSISELHGLVTGLMTVCHAPNDSKDWVALLTELSFAIPDDAALNLLASEAEDIAFELKDRDDAYQYSPLVPDDEHELYERVIALKQWANGFMTGFGVTGSRLTEEETVVLRDLSHIGALRIESDADFEGGEESYLHLYEFARMVPVSLSTRKRKVMRELPLISGLDINAKTAWELNETEKLRELPPIIDAMNQDNPS